MLNSSLPMFAIDYVLDVMYNKVFYVMRRNRGWPKVFLFL